MPKNPAAVALGKRRSADKSKAARRNGKLGGAPTLEQRFVKGLDKAIEFHRTNIGSHDATRIALVEVRDAFATAFSID